MRSVNFSCFITLPFLFTPPASGRRKSGPLSGHPALIWGRMAPAQDRISGTAFRCNALRLERLRTQTTAIKQEIFMSGGHGHLEGSNKNIAILIAVLAALLAIAETGAKSSQTAVLTEHVEATNQWAFFQAKTVRQTVIRTAAEELDAQFKDGGPIPAAVKSQIEAWRKTVARYDSEPETNEGRKELAAS